MTIRNFSRTYSSEESNILEDFYLPALRGCTSYDRAVGYFSGPMLAYAAKGLGRLIDSNGCMRLVIGDPLEPEEYEAVARGAELARWGERISLRLSSILESTTDELTRHYLSLLSWLTASRKLQIKIALLPRGIYHEKIGIIGYESGEKIVFQGSANETISALLPDLNYESISVYPSTDAHVFELYGAPRIEKFERLWTGQARKVLTVDLPSAAYERLANWCRNKKPDSELEPEFLKFIRVQPTNTSEPHLPEVLNGQPYALMSHQRRAIKDWMANHCRGILALATGAGKTVTALHAATAIAQAQVKAKNSFVLIVAVPYQILADQWAEIMASFGMRPIKCYRSKDLWHQMLRDAIASQRLRKDGHFFSVVVVNASLKKSEFQEAISELNPQQIMWVGDECHHHFSESLIKKIPAAGYMLGLSATPWNSGDMKKEAIAKPKYGAIVARYGLKEALEDGVLTPYRYYIHRCYLAVQEADAYEALSLEIGKMIAVREQGGAINEDRLNQLLSERSRLLGSANNKFEVFSELLSARKPSPHTLFYCGDGAVEDEDLDFNSSRNGCARVRDVERVTEILADARWKVSRFTAEESHGQRQRIMQSFRETSIDAVVAIRVLDEGFDMPSCREAFLLASSRSERQYIQRRGRVLRKAPGKEEAIIHDFLVLPPPGRQGRSFSALAAQELVRAEEFCRLAVNVSEGTKVISLLCEHYKVSYAEIQSQGKVMQEGL